MAVRSLLLLASMLVCTVYCVHAMRTNAPSASPKKKGVRVSLTAKWPATPLLHEAAEFLVRCFDILMYTYDSKASDSMRHLDSVFENDDGIILCIIFLTSQPTVLLITTGRRVSGRFLGLCSLLAATTDTRRRSMHSSNH